MTDVSYFLAEFRPKVNDLPVLCTGCRAGVEHPERVVQALEAPETGIVGSPVRLLPIWLFQIALRSNVRMIEDTNSTDIHIPR